jgi:hypothetical protein
VQVNISMERIPNTNVTSVMGPCVLDDPAQLAQAGLSCQSQRNSWEVAGTRGRPQVPVGLGVLIGDGRCLLGKTAQCSSVSSIKVRHYFELTARSRNSVVGICLETINYNNLGRVFEHGPYF